MQSLSGLSGLSGLVAGASAPAVRNATSGTTTTITLPVRSSGDALLLSVTDSSQFASASATLTGWALVGRTEGFGVYTKTASGVESGPAWPISGGNGVVTWACLSVQDCVTGVEASALAAYTNNVASRAAPSVTAGGAGRLLVTIGALRDSQNGWGGAITLPVGQTSIANRNSDNAGNLSTASRVGAESVGSGATGTRTVTTASPGFSQGFAAINVLFAN